MRRVLSIGRVVMVYLLLGFVTTWAVAWGLALKVVDRQLPTELLSSGGEITGRVLYPQYYMTLGSSRIGFASYELLSHAGGSLVGPFFSGLTLDLKISFDTPTIMYPLATTGPHGWGQRHQLYEAGLGSESFVGIDDARGFPVLALWCGWEGASAIKTDSMVGGIQLGDTDWNGNPVNMRTVRVLPYYPIWSGLALNTVFYALVFFVLVRLVKGTRHLLRFRRGLCPLCKYDRVFDYRLPCPECGCEGGKACKRKNNANTMQTAQP